MGRVLGALRIRAWRFHLETPDVLATVPMLRGVWGAALKSVAPTVYDQIFEGGATGIPRYLMRPSAPDVRPAPAVDFMVFGEPDGTADAAIWAAWDRACEMGLGPDRRAFWIGSTIPLAWDETPLRPSRVQPGFVASPLAWPINDLKGGCRLLFPAPLRLIHKRRLVERPMPVDLTIAALRRLQGLVSDHPDSAVLWESRQDWIELARTIRYDTWQGRRLDLARYSGSQQSELVLHGVAGSLSLPDGPGPLAPLLMAASWFHLGKGTVMGLGQVRIESLSSTTAS